MYTLYICIVYACIYYVFMNVSNEYVLLTRLVRDIVSDDFSIWFVWGHPGDDEMSGTDDRH